MSEFANLVDRSTAQIYSYRTRPETKPPFELVQEFCRVLGCPLEELWTIQTVD